MSTTQQIDAALAAIASGQRFSDCEAQAMLATPPAFPNCGRPDVGGLAAMELAEHVGGDRFGRGRGLRDIHV